MATQNKPPASPFLLRQVGMLLVLLMLLLPSSTVVLGQVVVESAEDDTVAVPSAAAPADLTSTSTPVSLPPVTQAATTITPTTTTTTTTASPSALSTGTRTRSSVPRQQKFAERHPMLTAIPDSLKAMTYPEMQAAFSGTAATVVPSSDDQQRSAAGGPITPQANGAGGAGFSDSRFGTGTDYASIASRRVGRLSMRFGGKWSVCTASVINRALLVTAAHCVFNFGKTTTGWPDRDAAGNLQVSFEPGLDGSSKPFGTWWAMGVMVPTPYYDGTDTSMAGSTGVVVNNDVALVWLKPNSANQQVGNLLGYFGWGNNGWSFSAPAAGWGIPTAPATGMLTQFGYPAAFDSGTRMQISNAATYTLSNSNANLRNMIRGSAMTGGSSGGPWIANYGVDAALSNTNYGSNANRNIILGVTSWGYTDANAKVQGASFFGTNTQYPSTSTFGTFGAGNMAKLMFDACDNSAGWQLRSKGMCA